MRLHRRALIAGGLSAGTLALLARRGRAQDNPWAQALEEYGRVRPATYETAMPVPPVLAPVAVLPDADVYELTARAGAARPLRGVTTPILGYDGAWPGPTIRATRGRALVLRLRNALEETTNIHNHGHNAAAEHDGHPLDGIPAGGVREYRYRNRQSAGSYWYHDHAMGLTAPHVYRGLAGFYLIDDPEEQALGLPSGAHDVPVVIQDRMFGLDDALRYELTSATIFTGFLGNTLCANGVHAPRFEVAARRYRFRFLNGSNARNLRLALEGGEPLVQIAGDGSLLAAPLARAAIDLAPSERCDCVIDFARVPVGKSLRLLNLDATWPALPEVLRFDVARREPDPSRVPAKLAAIVPLDPRKAKARRRISFEISDGKWTMNGLRYDPARIDLRPRLGTVEIWQLHNTETTQMHPFHQHLVPFQVLDVNGAPPPPELRGWKDTVAVAPAAKVNIIMAFQGDPGVYVLHCHKLEHEDHAMMLQQEVS